MSTSFQEVRTFLGDFHSNPEKVLEHMAEIWELATEMDGVGTDVLGSKEDSYIKDFMALVQASTLTYMLQSGESNVSKVLFMSQDDDISKYIWLSIKLAIGLAVMEELR